MGPVPAETSSTPPDEVYGPAISNGLAETIPHPDRIVLVFGPGLVHGYAYVGVLRALRELKVDVHSIYGTEIGALAGALYYTQPNPNRIDWALLRFTDKNLQKSSGKFSFRLKSPESELEAKLREVFGDRPLESLSGKLHVALEDVRTHETFEPKGGELWKILRSTLAGANGFSSIEIEGRESRGSNRSIAETFSLARQREGYPVVAVVAGPPPGEGFRQQALEQQGFVLSIPMDTISNTDLKRRNQAVFLGKNAINQSAPEILKLIGRSPATQE